MLLPANLLSQNTFYDLAVNVGEAVLAALVAEGEPSMVDTAEVEDCGLHVVHVDAVRGDIPGEVVGGAVDVPPFHPPASEPPAEGFAEVVAADRVFGVTLAEGRAPEFASPDDERVVEHSSVFKVLDERGGGGVGVFALHF